MTLKIDIKSLVFGLVLGIAILLGLGADSEENKLGKYQIDMAVGRTHVYYAKIQTDTGKVEIWRMNPSDIEERK